MSNNKETAKQIIQIIGEDNITFMTTVQLDYD